MGRESGLNNLSRGPGETAHWSPTSGTRRDVRTRPTQGRVAPAKGNAKFPDCPRDEGGPRDARPASLHGLVGQVPEQRQGGGPKATKGLDRQLLCIHLQRETKEKARQPETKRSASAQTRHIAGLRDAKRSRTSNPKPTHGARDRPKQPQPRAVRDRASEPGRRHASRRTRPTDTGTRERGGEEAEGGLRRDKVVAPRLWPPRQGEAGAGIAGTAVNTVVRLPLFLFIYQPSGLFAPCMCLVWLRFPLRSLAISAVCARLHLVLSSL
jgi:hypothetical protein